MPKSRGARCRKPNWPTLWWKRPGGWRRKEMAELLEGLAPSLGCVIRADVIFGMSEQKLTIRRDSGNSARPYLAGDLLAHPRKYRKYRDTISI